MATLPGKDADHVGQAVLIQVEELVRVRLPAINRTIDVVECMPDLVTHHIGSRRRPGTNDHLALTVSARTNVPGGTPRRQWDAAERAHAVQVGNSARTHIDRIQPGEQSLLDELRQLS